MKISKFRIYQTIFMPSKYAGSVTQIEASTVVDIAGNSFRNGTVADIIKLNGDVEFVPVGSNYSNGSVMVSTSGLKTTSHCGTDDLTTL